MRNCIMKHADSRDETICRILKESRSIAVLGLSDKPWRDSHRVAAYLLQNGYRVIPVNPEISEVFGLRSFPDLESVGSPIDLVDVFRRREFIREIVQTAIVVRVGALWTQYGLTDVEAAAAAEEAGIPMIMDRCLMVEHVRHFG